MQHLHRLNQVMEQPPVAVVVLPRMRALPGHSAHGPAVRGSRVILRLPAPKGPLFQAPGNPSREPRQGEQLPDKRRVPREYEGGREALPANWGVLNLGLPAPGDHSLL